MASAASSACAAGTATPSGSPPSASRPERPAYWSDGDFGRVTAIIDADLTAAFAHVHVGGVVVCPTSGLGTGLAELPTRAPRVFAHLRQRIIALKRITPSSG